MRFNHHLFALCFGVFVSSTASLKAGAFFEAKLASAATDQGLVEADLNWQASAEFGFGDFYLGAWSLTPLEEKGSPIFFEERYEIYLGRGWALADTFGIDFGATRLIHPSAEDATEAYLGLFAELGSFSPAFYIYNDFDSGQWSAEASATVSVPLNLFPVDATARLGAVDGDFDYRYFELDLIYPIELSDSARLSIGLHYSDNDFGDGEPDGSLFGSAAASFSF